MSSFNVIDVLKQRILDEQKKQETTQKTSILRDRDIRDTRDARAPMDTRDIRDTKDDRDMRDNRDTRDNRDREFRTYRDSRSERASFRPRHERRERDRERDLYRDATMWERQDRREYRGSDRRNYRDSGFRDRDYRDHRDHRDHRDSRYRDRERGNKRLEDEDLTSVIPIDQLERQSKWDLKPTGFEKISSERAKISGLFPLPGEQQKIDISKLEGLVSKGDINGQTAILFEQIKICNSFSSKLSKILIITGVEFTLFPVERLVEYLNKFIDNLKIKEVETSTILHHELINNKALILKLSDAIITTILFSSFRFFQNDLNLKIFVSRPHGYVTPNPSYEENDEDQENQDKQVDQFKPKIPDSIDKIVITNIPKDIHEDDLKHDLNEISKVDAIELIRDKEDVFKGVAFVKFRSNNVETIIEAINKIKIGELTLYAMHASKGLNHLPQNISFRSIAEMVKPRTGEKSRVLVLLNVIHPEDLKNESVYEFLHKDIKEECYKYGEVENMKIPKPPKDYKRNLKSLNSSIGKIFVKFKDLESAEAAFNLINGRKYNERTVLVSFLPELDYDLDIF